MPPVSSDVQPYSLPRLRPQISAESPMRSRTVPGISKRAFFPGMRCERITGYPMIAAAAANEIVIKKIPRQPSSKVIAPPRGGPIKIPSDVNMAAIPSPHPFRASESCRETIAGPTDKNIAAPPA